MVVGDTTFEREAEVRFDEISGRAGAAEADLFLGGSGEEDSIGVWSFGEPAHGFDHYSAADAIVPGFAEIVIGAVEDLEGRVRDDGVAGLNTHSGGFSGRMRADVEEDVFARDNHGTFGGRSDVDVTDTGDGFDRTFAAENNPALVDKGLVEPAAEHLHGELAVGGDAADHATELIHVGVDHDAGAGGAKLRDDGAHAVVAEGRGGKWGHLRDHELANGIFGPGRSRGVGELLKEAGGRVELLSRQKGWLARNKQRHC